jgi:hypothetical protein
MITPTLPVTKQESNVAREALLVKEKEVTRARDALAAERRRLPMVHVDKEYRFEARDTTMVFVSGGSQDVIGAYRTRMGWGRLALVHDARRFLGGLRRRSVVGHQRVPAGRRSDLPHLLRLGPGRRGSQQHLGAAGHHAVRTAGGVAGRSRGVPQDRTGSWTRRSGEYTTDELAGGRPN